MAGRLGTRPWCSCPANVRGRVGNLARCDRQQDEQTALVLDAIPGTVFTARDNGYGGGALSDYQHCYGPSWDRHVAHTRPAVGDEDYRTTGAAGYFSYFGAAAGDPGRGYYSDDSFGAPSLRATPGSSSQRRADLPGFRNGNLPLSCRMRESII